MAKNNKKLCRGYVTALRHAEQHTKKAFKKIDAENKIIDQKELASRV